MSRGPSRLVVRPARPDDLDRLMRIETQAFSGDRLDRRAMRHAIRSPSISLLVAEESGRVVGDAIVERRRGSRTARLSSIAIAPEATGRGVGGRLLTEVEDDCRRHGCTRLRLEVRADNAAAIALYERHGYRRVGDVRDYYEDGETALRFEKELGA